MQNTDVPHLGLFSSPCLFLKIEKCQAEGRGDRREVWYTMTILAGSDWKLLCSEVSLTSPSSGTEHKNIQYSQKKSLGIPFFRSGIILMMSSR